MLCGLKYHSFNKGSSASRHIHLQLSKQKFFTQTKSIFGNVFNTNTLHFTRWSDRGQQFSKIPCSIVIGYMSRFDNMHNEDVCVTLIYFPVVVWHQTNRVMLQFGLFQDISNPPHYLDKFHHIDMRGNNDTNRTEEHQRWIQANSKIFLTRFTTHLSVATTSHSAPNIGIEQYPPQQSPPVVANMHDEGLQPHAQSYEFTPQHHHHQEDYGRLYEQPHGYRSSNTRVYLCVPEKKSNLLFLMNNLNYKNMNEYVDNYTKGPIELNATLRHSPDEILVLLRKLKKPRKADEIISLMRDESA
ncbi:hypothetical protein HKD37_20G055675 [Glycine soja]